MKLYGRTLMLKRGTMLQISLTYACQYRCEYCTLKMPTGKQPMSRGRLSFEEWQERIKNFPVKVREVYISGGEPTLVSYMPDLCNWLLDVGYHVTIFTNLHEALKSLTRIKPSYRLQIWATFHKGHRADLFGGAYHYLKGEGYNITAEELGEKTLDFTKLMQFTTVEALKDPSFRMSPDGQLFTSCYEHYKEKSR